MGRLSEALGRLKALKKEQEEIYREHNLSVEQTMRDFEGDTVEVIPGIESRLDKPFTLADFAIPGAKIGDKLSLNYNPQFKDLMSRLTNYIPPTQADFEMDHKIYRIAKAITQTRPWLAYSECEAIARDVIKELEK